MMFRDTCNINDIKIKKNVSLTDTQGEDCFYIIAQTNYTLAESFFCDVKNMAYNKNRVLFTACTPRLIVGLIMGQVYATEKIARIDYLYVDRDFKRIGIGRRLLNAFEEHVLVNCDVENIVVKSVPNAKYFYFDTGYAPVKDNILCKNFSR